ncbi:MAG: 2,3-bisphosphoglycerate-independent phosphoglycerate mutase [Candidatus Berkelbacteria bacterium]|nr:2,3-bisphosphoglycerate-independent phosphoglycerate mutase [Candidatus Berkelbacteria bacterium]
MNETRQKVALIILDGWGIGPVWGGNAISSAKKPNFDFWWRTFPKTELLASGEAVGLPAGTGGNSETGHLNIGAGRVVPQDLPYINRQIENGEFFKNEKILAAFEHVKKNNSRLHIIGLAGNGIVHSCLNHLYKLLQMAKQNGIARVCLDLFTDGRDSDPTSALSIFEKITAETKRIGIGQINSICGRFFAMDRDKNWGRTSRAYNSLTKGEAEVSKTVREAISRCYLKNINDEFIEPQTIIPEGGEKVTIDDNDAVIFFNFRPDRAKQISQAFVGGPIKQMPDRKILKNLYFLTFVTRDPNPLGIQAFEPVIIKNSLAEVLSQNNLTQYHSAETEKFAHVTYFFDGGNLKPFAGEKQILQPSPKVLTYDLTPEMSAMELTSKTIAALNYNFDFLVINYANADMVGHCGNFSAAVQAVESVDQCLGRLIVALSAKNYLTIITADHGNAEEMINPATGKPQTEHTANPVPFVIVSKDIHFLGIQLKFNGALCNIAPTILEIMKIEKPEEMTAASLIAGRSGIVGSNLRKIVSNDSSISIQNNN